MVFENLIGTSSDTFSAFTSGALSSLLAVGIALGIVFAVGLYVYFAFAWMKIAKEMKHKSPWLAWIPFANIALILQLGKFHWALVFLALIPVLGWLALIVLYIIANWRVFEKRKYPGWFSLSLVIPKVGSILYYIALGFVAWKKKK